MRRLDGASAFMVYVEGPQSYQHTLKIAFIEGNGEAGGYDYADLLRRIEVGLDSVPYARWKLAMPPLSINHPYWIQDLNFNVSHHVTRIACPRPGDRQALCELISNLLAQPLDRSLPLWKLWVIEGLEGGRIALVNMLHHAYTDGTGFSNLLKSLTESEVQPVLASEDYGVDSHKNPSRLRMFVHSLLELPLVIGKSLYVLARGGVKLHKVKKSFKQSGKPLPPQPRDAPPSSLNTVLTAGRTFYYDPIPFAEFKAACEKHGVTVNELLLTVVTGALRLFFQQRGYSLDRPLVSSVAVNARTGDKSNAILGNVVGGAYVSLPIQVEDPAERLALVKQSSRIMKDYLKATEGISVVEAISVLPPAATSLAKWLVKRKHGQLGILGNLVVSNVPGPKDYLLLPHMGGKLVDWLSTGQLAFDMGFNITAWRYVDNLNVCLMADKSVVQDGEAFLALVMDAFAEYRDQVNQIEEEHHDA